MPNINLYYIENISETDIPYFPTIEAMSSFMSSHLLTNATGEENYYVPYYRNVIKMSKDTFNYDTHACNYLSLYINGRTYYYFIDSIDYINEDCYAINIHMDTIMSFYWQIGVSACMIERKFINRWGDTSTPTINRNYIRENYSNGNYKITGNNIYAGNVLDKWVVIAELNHVTFDEHSASPEANRVASVCNNWSQPTREIFIDSNGNSINFPSSHKQGSVFFSFANAVNDIDTYTLDNYQAKYNYPSYTYTSPINSNTDSVDGGTLDNPINQLSTNANLHNIYIIPFIPFSKDVQITSQSAGSRTYNITFNPLYINFGGFDKPVDDPIKLRYGFVRGAYSPNYASDLGQFKGAYANKMSPYAPIRSVVQNALYNLSGQFYKNSSIGVDFTTGFIPQLIDTNYVQLTFGTYYANTTYPIEYLTKPEISGKYFADCFTGKRYYYITPSNTNYTDTYATIVCDDNILSLEMINDPWKQYEANNRSRWATIGVGAGVNAIKDLIMVANIAGGMGAINDSANLNKYIYGTQISNRKKSKNNDILKARMALTEVDRKEDIRSSQMGMLKSGIGILDTATAVTSQLEHEYNLQHAPQSVIRGGDETSVASSNAWAIRWITRKCENIEQVAQVYHRTGFLVNEYYPNNARLTDLLSYCNTRYYFNVLKLGECAVHINGRLENEDITTDIKYRLQQGIRYWNISVTNFELCNFKYDNVELDYLP